MTTFADRLRQRAGELEASALSPFERQDYQRPPPEWHKSQARWWNKQWGRGCGKSVSAARDISEHVATTEGCGDDGQHLISIGTPKKADEIRHTIFPMLKAHLPAARLVGGSDIRMPGANVVTISMTSEQTIEDARGPASNSCMAWIEEPGSARHFYDMFQLLAGALRKGPMLGIISGTPKKTPQYRKVVESPEVVTTRAETKQNRLADPDWIRSLYRQYKGTALEAQELRGEMLTDAPGALWRSETIERGRFDRHFPLPKPTVLTLGVDPGEKNATTGAGVIAKFRDCPCGQALTGNTHLVVADDIVTTEGEWLEPVIGGYNHWQGYGSVVVVSETNYKGDEVRSTLKAADPEMRFIPVRASSPKEVRARPFAAMYRPTEEDPIGRVHHLGHHDELELEQTLWVPRDRNIWSPHRLDAIVHAATYAAQLKTHSSRWFVG